MHSEQIKTHGANQCQPGANMVVLSKTPGVRRGTLDVDPPLKVSRQRHFPKKNPVLHVETHPWASAPGGVSNAKDAGANASSGAHLRFQFPAACGVDEAPPVGAGSLRSPSGDPVQNIATGGGNP